MYNSLKDMLKKNTVKDRPLGHVLKKVYTQKESNMQKANNSGRKGVMGRGFQYDITFMRMVAAAYENGDESLNQVAARFEVSRQQVKTWRLKFSSELGINSQKVTPMTEQEQKEFEALKKQNEELAKKLEYANLQVFGLQTMIDVAEEQLKIDIRKKSGSKPSKK